MDAKETCLRPLRQRSIEDITYIVNIVKRSEEKVSEFQKHYRRNVSSILL